MSGDSSELARHWTLDPSVAFLNHGSFGACPKPVLEAQSRLRERFERQPVQFFVRELSDRLDEARAVLAEFVRAEPDDLAWVQNATTGVNTVLRSLRFDANDELLVTDHEYNACRNALDFVAERAGIRVRVVTIPFPLGSTDVVETIVAGVTERTRLVLVDHVTSPTGMILPVERLAHKLAAKGVELLVDGAHAPGMLDLDVPAIGATYYVGHCHKWICAPKGVAFLWVRRDRQPEIRPLVISHGANADPGARSRFQLEFDWVGTIDPTAALCVPEALRFLSTIVPGGWGEIRARNRGLALEARQRLCGALEIDPPCPDSMIGSLAALPLPISGESAGTPSSPLYSDPLQRTLLNRYGIEVPVIPWPDRSRRLIRVSAQLYNRIEQYERLAKALTELLH